MSLKFDPNIDLSTPKKLGKNTKTRRGGGGSSVANKSEPNKIRPRSAVGDVRRKNSVRTSHNRHNSSRTVNETLEQDGFALTEDLPPEFLPTDPKVAKKRAKKEMKMQKKAAKNQAAMKKEEERLAKKQSKEQDKIAKAKARNNIEDSHSEITDNLSKTHKVDTSSFHDRHDGRRKKRVVQTDDILKTSLDYSDNNADDKLPALELTDSPLQLEAIETADISAEEQELVAESFHARAQRRRAEARKERDEISRKRYRSFVTRIVLVVCAILIVIFGAIFFYRSDFFTVENVQVEGVSHLTSEEITQLAAVPKDTTLLRVDTFSITSRLKEHAWIQDVAVNRNFPDTITISITERKPAACVKINSDSIWVISTDCAWLSAATQQDWDSNRKIIDVTPSITSPSSGCECTDEGVKNAIKIFDELPQDFASEIDTVSAESTIKTQLNLKSGVVVAFGAAENIDQKVAVINELLEKHAGKISYINVRTPSRPTYRSM